MTHNTQTKSAFIAITGRPNVGKSSLLNTLLGQKIAIVSNKPQTTRTRIMGVLTKDSTQFVFIDTPGLHKPKTSLGKYMVKSINESVAGVDVCVLVVEAGKSMQDSEKELIERFKALKLPAVLVINKIDLVLDKSLIISQITEFMKGFEFSAVVPLSAKTGDGISSLTSELDKLANVSDFFFDEDTLTDQPERVIVSEMIREKMLRLLDKEIPHGIAVSVEKMRTRENKPDIIDIDATIYCEKASHKGIIIGKSGSMLKRIGKSAREDIESFFDCKVNLQLWVKVKEDWRNREGLLKNFGFDKNDFNL